MSNLIGPGGEHLSSEENQINRLQVGYDSQRGLVIMSFSQPCKALGLPVAEALKIAHQIFGFCLGAILPQIPECPNEFPGPKISN